MNDSNWLRLLTYVSGLVDQELLLQNDYRVAENGILHAHLSARLCLSNPERSTLAWIDKRLGRHALAQLANAKESLSVVFLRSPQNQRGFCEDADAILAVNQGLVRL